LRFVAKGTDPPGSGAAVASKPPDAATVALGRRLRDLRQSLGLTLFDVQQQTNNSFKTSALGAYERGERQLTIARLAELAQVYGASAAELLPGGRVIDLPALSAGEADRKPDDRLVLPMLRRFADHVIERRSERAVRPMIRMTDAEMLSVLAGKDLAELSVLLTQIGVRLPARRGGATGDRSAVLLAPSTPAFAGPAST
jgi:transcriptional regulator with XRE-family HTH domain